MAEPSRRQRCFITFAVLGDLRFISHHDTMRLWRRALARAELPVRYSEGFNPHPRFSLPLPRPVGIASDAEVLIAEFEEPVEPADCRERLHRQMPFDLKVKEVRSLAAEERPKAEWVRYQLVLDGEDLSVLQQRVQRVLDERVVEVTRRIHRGGKVRRIDVRPRIIDLSVRPEHIAFTVSVNGEGSVRPAEIAGLLGFDEGSINHRILRLEVRWK